MRFITVLSVLVYLLVTNMPVHSQSTNYTCKSRFSNRQLGPKLVSAILVDHQAWFTEALENKARFYRDDPRRANLCQANLARTNLQNAFLDRAVLQQVNLHGADLRRADLSSANLVQADLSHSKLQYAFLIKSNLRHANLQEANLSHVVADGAELSEANLRYTNLHLANFVAVTLTGADLRNANLHKTNLYQANMGNTLLGAADLLDAIFEPKAHSLPSVTSLLTAKNLETMNFATFPHALEALREALRQAGMREQERQVSLAIERTVQAKIKKTPWRRSMFEKR